MFSIEHLRRLAEEAEVHANESTQTAAASNHDADQFPSLPDLEDDDVADPLHSDNASSSTVNVMESHLNPPTSSHWPGYNNYNPMLSSYPSHVSISDTFQLKEAQVNFNTHHAYQPLFPFAHQISSRNDHLLIEPEQVEGGGDAEEREDDDDDEDDEGETSKSTASSQPTVKDLRKQRKNMRRQANREEKRRHGSSKPANAFMLYRRDRAKEIREKYREERNGKMETLGFADVSRLCGKLWRSEGQHVRDAYVLAANKLANEHKLLAAKRKEQEMEMRPVVPSNVGSDVMAHAAVVLPPSGDNLAMDPDPDLVRWQEFYDQHI
ncbi:hypothetical protein BDR26DRAFT_869010 [Obelidium mucronatum]|nr:hypothetical protein BDR26DRAFT_869010 [Obelidium mucronatum]